MAAIPAASRERRRSEWYTVLSIHTWKIEGIWWKIPRVLLVLVHPLQTCHTYIQNRTGIIFSSSCATYPDLTFSSHLWSEHFLFDFSGIYLMSGLLAGRHMAWFSLEIARYVCMYAGRYARINISVINSTIPFGRCGQEGVPRSILTGRDTITLMKTVGSVCMYVCMRLCVYIQSLIMLQRWKHTVLHTYGLVMWVCIEVCMYICMNARKYAAKP